MRLKLVHQLSLLLGAAALLAVLAVSAVVWWNLQAGFSDYVKARDSSQLDRLAQIIAARSDADPELEWLRGSRAGMESLLTEFRGFERPPRPEGRPPRDDSRPPSDRFEGRPPPRPMGPAPNRPPSSDSIEGWIQIYSANGQWLAGRPQSTSPSMVRLVRLQGATIAEIRLFRNEQPSSVDAAFLNRQYMGLGLAGAAALLVSLLMGWLVARRWVQPLKAVQQAAMQVAAGDLSVRTQPTGALEIAQLMRDVNHMTESLDGLQKARRLWIAQISHELRTPLSVLRGELESVQDGARIPNAAFIRNLLDEVLHLGRLVGDLHTLSMADVGQLHCEFVLQNAMPELIKLTQRYGAEAMTRGLQFHAPTHSVDIMARWDMRRIHQVLTNLFENSLRYTDAPGRILVDWHIAGHDFYFTIEDSAPNVPADALLQMFEPLYRADAARTRRVDDGKNVGGSGLGLAITKAIVHAHQGKITASLSKLGGVKIELVLPLNHRGSPPPRG
jgi:two-component system sensor histidine kinase BaeS